MNIFIYKRDEYHPHGDIVIPRHSQAYLLREIDTELPTVFILKNSISEEYSYQCELLVRYDPRRGIAKQLKLSFKGDRLVTEAAALLKEVNVVNIVQPGDEGVLIYNPVDVF